MGEPTQGGRAVAHPLWHVWRGMLARCKYPNNSNYKNYGGRGIKVCERWTYLPNFVDDMWPSYFHGGTIERIDNDGDYTPENCRWATVAEQAKNKRVNRFLDTPWGKMTLLDTARHIGIAHATLRERLEKGWPPHRLYAAPSSGWRVESEKVSVNTHIQKPIHENQ